MKHTEIHMLLCIFQSISRKRYNHLLKRIHFSAMAHYDCHSTLHYKTVTLEATKHAPTFSSQLCQWNFIASSFTTVIQCGLNVVLGHSATIGATVSKIGRRFNTYDSALLFSLHNASFDTFSPQRSPLMTNFLSHQCTVTGMPKCLISYNIIMSIKRKFWYRLSNFRSHFPTFNQTQSTIFSYVDCPISANGKITSLLQTMSLFNR